MNTSIIRQALTHSLYVGIMADWPWYTTLQQKALDELKELEKDNGNAAPSVLATCLWPKEEECET